MSVRSLILSLFWTLPVLGATFSLRVSDQVPEQFVEDWTHLVEVSWMTVNAYPPEKNDPFAIPFPREVEILATVSWDPFVVPHIQDTDADAMTLTDSHPSSRREYKTWICLLMDRLTFDSKSKHRRDGYARTVTALAHELYGNVPRQLLVMPSFIVMSADASKEKHEVEAFEAGIAFLHRMMADKSIFGKFEPSMKKDFRDALAREEALLAGWIFKKTCPPPKPAPKKKRPKP